jgi:CHAD domain-containing protein
MCDDRNRVQEDCVAYRLTPNRPVAGELKRVARTQLQRAAAELTAAGARLRPERVHAARKRVKKVRALVRLAAPALPKRTVRDTTAGLRAVSRRLGPIADAAAAIEALNRLARAHPKEVARRTAASLRRTLQQRDRAIRRAALKERTNAKCVHVLRAQARRAKRWRLDAKNVADLVPGLETSTRRARKAMKTAWRRPDVPRLHAWRRRVKDDWLQRRLLGRASGARPATVQKELESLDGVLGAYHDLALLRRSLEQDAALTREQTAALLGVIARARRKLRQRAKAFGEQIYGEMAA